jgi:dihydroflavonol-4-reductase
MISNRNITGTVLVTGADGFLGSNVVRELLSQGYAVRAMIQPGRNAGTIDGLPLEQMTADILSETDRLRALSGLHAVIHTVASTSVWPSRDPFIWKLNHEVPISLAREARNAGVARFVHVGTANSFAAGSRSNPGTEEGDYDALRFGLDYQDSKRAAQERLLALDAEGPEIVIVNPTFMFGPYDTKPGSGEMILKTAKRQVPGSSPGGRCFADVRAVAKGIVAALEKGIPGRCYILGGENLEYSQIFSLIAEATGVRAPRFTLPSTLIIAMGALASFFASLTGKAPKISLPMARIACEGQYYSSKRAMAELGYTIIPVREGIQAAVEWFRSKGML